jgi:hypothetical protein
MNRNALDASHFSSEINFFKCLHRLFFADDVLLKTIQYKGKNALGKRKHMCCSCVYN